MRPFLGSTRTQRVLLTLSTACLVVSAVAMGIRGNRGMASAANDEEFLRFVNVAAEIYGEIKGKYVDEVKSTDVLEAALAGMFNALDEHSQYMNPAMLDSLNKDTGGSFSGIGIHITQRQGLLTVIAPIPGSPSARIGLAPWDRIVEIDGETTEGITLQEAVQKLTGPEGTQVTIKIYREGEPEPLEFTITRAQIKIDSVHYKMMEDGIGYLRIAKFSDNTSADMRRAIADMKSQGMRGLLLDLRYNTGGLLREAIDVADLFVPKHELIVSTKGRLRSQNTEHRAKSDPFVKLPTFVLVNEGSASASEIVAGALQDHHLAVVIGPKGRNTFGKGSVQTIESLRHSMYDDANGNPKQSAIRLTTARYYTPSGRTIHNVGITPDIGVALTAEEERNLLRHGLYGDTTIPLTKEEEEAREKARREAEERRRAGAEGGIAIQTPDTTTIAPTPTPAPNTTTPFYSGARRPEVVEKTAVTDTLLEEAIKQMKIYLILDRTATERAPAVARATANEPAAAAAPAGAR
jgi:carboxyl-terminal processing protease